LRLTPLERNARGALSFFAPAVHVAGQVPGPAEGPASPYTAPARVILSGAIYETRLFGALVELGS